MEREKIVSYACLSDIRRLHHKDGIVFVSGTYDLLHPGHVHFFELCKEYGNVLVVGVGCDADIKRYKGETRPILAEHERLGLVAALEVVDYAFISYAPPLGVGHFLDGFIEIFQKLQPNIYVINDDTFDIHKRSELARAHDIKLVILSHSTACLRCRNVSASQIMQRVFAAVCADQAKSSHFVYVGG